MEALTTQLPASAEFQPLAAEPSMGLRARIGNTLRNGYDAISDRVESMKDRATALVALGGIAFVGAQAAELAVNTEPVAAENTSTLVGSSNASASATVSGNLRQKCASDILRQPQILDNTMYDPGKNDQTTYIRLKFGAVDPACDRHFTRRVSVLPELVRHGHIIREAPLWAPILNSNDSSEPSYVGAVSVNQPKLFWQPGDKARFMLRLIDHGTATNKTVKKVTKVEPLEVRH